MSLSRSSFVKSAGATRIVAGFPTILVAMGHRACSTCLIHQGAMHADGLHLHWNPQAEYFMNDDAANVQLKRPQRAKYAFMA